MTNHLSSRAVCLLLICTIFLTGCNVTFQSGQYNFIKGLFESEDTVVQKNWQAVWQGRIFEVYAVNHVAGTFFVNEEGFVLNFDGWQALDLTLPGNGGLKTAALSKVVSENGSVSLQFENVYGQELGSHQCSAWQPTQSVAGESGWQQQCSASFDSYVNEIRLNKANELIGLRFTLVPETDPIEVSLR